MSKLSNFTSKVEKYIIVVELCLIISITVYSKIKVF